MRLVTALLVRDEADKYLPRVLKRCAEFSDEILVLDDGSTDDTVTIATEMGCLVKQRPQSGMWGNESPARAELFERATKLAKGGWVLVNDGDQLLVGDPRPLVETWESNTICFPLYDLWDSENTFRADGYWAGYRVARPWLVRPSFVPDGWTPQWSGRGLHCGHLPINWPMVCPVQTDMIYWAHLGYLTKSHREQKYARYLEQRDALTPGELSHARSILDDSGPILGVC